MLKNFIKAIFIAIISIIIGAVFWAASAWVFFLIIGRLAQG